MSPTLPASVAGNVIRSVADKIGERRAVGHRAVAKASQPG
jgi:hypothetical protein